MKRSRAVILSSPQTWSKRVNTQFDEELQAWMRQFPGAYWHKKEKTWRFPKDLVPKLRRKLDELGYDDVYEAGSFLIDPVVTPAPVTSTQGHTLYSFQEEDLNKVLGTLMKHGAAHATWEMGLGKAILNALVLRYLNMLEEGTELVIAPRQGISPVKDELAAWAPHLEVHEILPTAKKRWLVKSGAVNVISYGLVHRALEELDWPDITHVTMDEIHELKNPRTRKTLAVQKLLAGPAGNATLLGLTGTLVSNKVDSMLHPLEILYPGRFKDNGNPNHFYFRHMESEPGGYGHRFFGVREDTLDELHERLALTGVRRTKREVAHLLPGFTGPVPVESGDLLKDARDLAIEALEQGQSHISIHTTRRRSAHKLRNLLVRKLGGGWEGEVAVLTGEDTTDTRDATRARLESQTRSILVSTIKSMKVGVNLSWNDVAIYAEVTNDLEAMLQSLGRYDRLYTGAVPTHVTFLYTKGDKTVRHMASKVKIYNAIQGKDRGSEGAAAALQQMADAHKLTPEDVQQLIELAATGVRTDFGTDWHEEKL